MAEESDMKNKPDEYWKEQLSEEQYDVCRLKSTERPFTGEYVHHKEDGAYTCIACGVELFSSEAKFDSGSGWPSFDDVMDADTVTLETDVSLGMKRTEVICTNCGSHLGHVFNDGPTTTGQRYCINSVALGFADKNKNT
jgi:peptide-methionine (R)-S-oxide reductase